VKGKEEKKSRKGGGDTIKGDAAFSEQVEPEIFW